MSVPTYDQFIEPTLRYLAKHPEGAPARDAHDAAADALGLTPEQRAEKLPSGRQAVYKNRAGWSHDRLKRAGLSSSPPRGYWKLTPAGHEYASKYPSALTDDLVEDLAHGYVDVRLRADDEAENADAMAAAVATTPTKASPDDRLDEALREIRQSVAAELLEAIEQGSPEFFEGLVLDVLHAMGYGADRKDLQRIGGTADGGVDGVISLDALGLEKIYVQAKRWQSSNTVSRPDIQAFFGALAGQRAKKGVFITTSSYTSHAVEFANTVEGIVLVDGTRLAEHMMDFGVGVSHRTIRIPEVDSDYFEE